MNKIQAFTKIRARSLMLWFIIGIVLANIGTSILESYAGLKSDNPISSSILSLAFYLSIVLWLLWKFRKNNLSLKEFIGPRPTEINWKEMIITALFLIIFSLGASMLYFYLLSYIAPEFIKDILNDKDFYTSADTDMPFLFNTIDFIFIVIIAPIVEELIWRGILLHRWSVKWGVRKAIFISAFTFGMLHFDIIGSFVFGIVMCILYIKTRSIIVPILYHMLNNLTASLWGFVSMMAEKTESVYTIEQLRSDAWIASIFLAVSLPWLIYYFRKNRIRKDLPLPFFEGINPQLHKMQSIKGIDHINRYVSDVDKFVAFYSDALCYKVIGRGTKENGKKYAILQGYGHELFISERDDFVSEGEMNFRHIGYSVDKIDEFLQALKAKGYVEDNAEIIIKKFSKQFYIKDPDGFEIDLIQWTDKKGFYSSLS